MASWEQYILEGGRRRGIDPATLRRVVMGEGGFKDPVRQSDVVNKAGLREPSYGPFQMLIGGEGTGFPEGLGNDALRMGIDPRKPEDAQKAADFALDTIARDGWGRWYGAKAAGITGMEGIQGRGVTLANAPPTGNAPMLDDPKTIATRPVLGAALGTPDATPAATPTVGDKIGSAIFGDEMAGKLKAAFGEGSPETSTAKTGLGLIGKSLGGDDSLAREHATPIQSSLGAAEAADGTRMMAAQQLMASLMAKKRPRGLTLGG